MSSDSEEADELQKEFDELMDENRRLKDSQVKVSQIPYSIVLTLKLLINFKETMQFTHKEIFVNPPLTDIRTYCRRTYSRGRYLLSEKKMKI